MCIRDRFRVESSDDRWRSSTYRLPLDRVMLAELALSLYALLAAYLLSTVNGWLSTPFMLLYAGSFASVLGVSLWQNRTPHAKPAKVSIEEMNTVHH